MAPDADAARRPVNGVPTFAPEESKRNGDRLQKAFFSRKVRMAHNKGDICGVHVRSSHSYSAFDELKKRI